MRIDLFIPKTVITLWFLNDNLKQKKMKKLLHLVVFAICILVSSCMSKEEKAKQQQEKARMERETRFNDSVRVENEKAEKEYQRLQELHQDSVKKAKRLYSIKNSIKITSYYLESPNSAGGVSVYFYYKNLSDKVVKYLTWSGHPINAVGDVVSCTIRDNSTFNGQDTGPVKKGATGGGYWDCAWYNWQAKKLIITGIEIEYMDGSTLSISDEDELYLIGKKKNK